MSAQNIDPLKSPYVQLSMLITHLSFIKTNPLERLKEGAKYLLEDKKIAEQSSGTHTYSNSFSFSYSNEFHFEIDFQKLKANIIDPKSLENISLFRFSSLLQPQSDLKDKVTHLRLIFSDKYKEFLNNYITTLIREKFRILFNRRKEIGLPDYLFSLKLSSAHLHARINQNQMHHNHTHLNTETRVDKKGLEPESVKLGLKDLEEQGRFGEHLLENNIKKIQVQLRNLILEEITSEKLELPNFVKGYLKHIVNLRIPQHQSLRANYVNLLMQASEYRNSGLCYLSFFDETHVEHSMESKSNGNTHCNGHDKANGKQQIIKPKGQVLSPRPIKFTLVKNSQLKL